MALQMTIPNRPFSTEPFTGLMMPDGFFEISLGKQRVNAHFTNNGAGPVNDVQFYIESVSHPGIVITPTTYYLGSAQSGVSYLYGWDADFSACVPGIHYISFIAESPAGKKRVIKKIFVTEVTFDTATKQFSVAYPEGTMRVSFEDFLGPKDGGCCDKKREDGSTPTTNGKRNKNQKKTSNILQILRREAERGSFPADFKLCTPYYLPHNVIWEIAPNPAYNGQYSDLPYQDPWWKILFCIIALLLLIASAIAEAVDGTGSVGVTTGGGSGSSGSGSCCGIGASGGGTSYVAAGLLAAAAAAATIAACSDVRDPIRRGQDHTIPLAGETTLSERLKAQFSYPEPVAPGKPFSAGLKWEYTRITTGNIYTYGANDVTQNIHILSHYDIDAPDVIRVYKRERFVVEASFFDQDNKQMKGNSLFVQCFLVGPQGQWRKFILEDHGERDDKKANDGIYTGGLYFTSKDGGLWTYYVIAQDINHAQTNMTPEEAAQIIGGMLLTNQLTISFEGGTCQFVPDGDVNVLVAN